MIRTETLPNGLRLITESMPHVRSVSFGVWLKRGSRHEPAPLNGISHFIEHLVFKGTENRTAREIALVMDSVGGHMDAFTSKEYTCFYAKVLDEHLPTAVDLLADIVRRPLFDATELERERQVIVEEIRMVEDTPEELVYDLLSERFYPRHPLGRPIQGTEGTVGGMSRRSLTRFFREAYVPANLLIVAAGHLRHDRLSRMVRKAFGSMKRGRRRKESSREPRASGGIVRRKKKGLEQLHLVLALPAFPESFAGRYPLFVLNSLLGGTMSSRLFQKIREERGLAYSVYSAVNAFADTGLLFIYAATNPRRGREVIDLVLEQLNDLREHGPRPEELRVAKEHIKGSVMLALESTSSRMSNLARQEIYFGRQYEMSELLKRIDAVKEGSVHSIARKLFSSGASTLAAVGRTEHLRVRQRDLQL